ncbi:lipid-A-disaccharide synthase-related protein [Nodosilinea sp. PGN35]|uniref:lipid-A-disaccharide synthase-related protein n=1 Tax=Nodosilinea sp. PGN35 TaxID=3020489 RepID=UPI0023B2D0B1|nr:lipid-A-disaccharide synthase-related protein [Nodosilinea sp. TSF1-S3]MDF0367938.1 lipid-A-disaccharide synthase-related protein [Nodosilinea sp. TSF1-S3]
MKLLCISNGHGEDGIAVRILKQLRSLPGAPALAALPIVGEGRAYEKAGIALQGPTQAMPSGGFIYMDRYQLWRDLRGGLVGLTLAQLKTARQWAQSGGKILAVGDIVPLAIAWQSGADYFFIGTAKSEYYLRNEAGRLPGRPPLEGWSGSVYVPWERWLMAHPRCRGAFVRDQLTADLLQKRGVPACYPGNPMMDDLDTSADRLAQLTAIVAPADSVLTLALLPGSRAPEAFDNWQRMVGAIAAVMESFGDRQVRLLAALAPSLNLAAFKDVLLDAGWLPGPGEYPTFYRGNGVVVLTTNAFAECLHLADAALATAGTATEQAVGLGKPVVTFPGPGPQFTYAFAEAQSRLLGPSIILLNQPGEAGAALQACLADGPRLQRIAENGRRRMGLPGAAGAIAKALHQHYGTSAYSAATDWAL